MAKRVLVPLAEGFEEIEAVTIVDVLRRAGINVVTASVDNEDKRVIGAHKISVIADCLLKECAEMDFDLIALPGGMPGAENLASSEILISLLKKQYSKQLPIAAICASPAVVLQAHGFVNDEKIACYPTFKDKIDVRNQSNDTIQVSNNLITAAGPGTAIEFSLIIVEKLLGKKQSGEIKSGMIVRD